MDDSAVLIHYRNRLRFAVISIKNYKQPALKNEPDYLHPANAESYGSNGVLMASSNNSTAAADIRNTKSLVFLIRLAETDCHYSGSNPAARPKTNWHDFLLTDGGLTVVRCLAAEREHQIAAQQKNEN
jgi:hypothetical protein